MKNAERDSKITQTMMPFKIGPSDSVRRLSRKRLGTSLMNPIITSLLVMILNLMTSSCGETNGSLHLRHEEVLIDSPRVLASIENLTIRNVRDGGRKEIYVVGVISDGHNWRDSSRSQLQGTLPEDNDGSQVGTMWAITPPNVFKRIGDKSPNLSLSGDGIVLYPGQDPSGILSIFVSVIEQDQSPNSVRKAAQSIENLVKQSGDLFKLKLIDPFAVVIPAIVRYYKKDDVLFTHCHSGNEDNNYGMGGRTTVKYKLCNDKVYATLKLQMLGTEDSTNRDIVPEPVDACSPFLGEWEQYLFRRTSK